MNITLEEARVLYAQDGVARKVALRAYSEGEILNDYTTIIKLPEGQKNTPTSDLYAKLYAVYKAMSAGRLVSLTSGTSYYQPKITISHVIQKPRRGKYVGKVDIDSGLVYSVYIDTCTTMYGGRFDWEGDGVYMGDGLFSNKWIFKEREQAEHFVKHFWKELIQVELGGFIHYKLYRMNKIKDVAKGINDGVDLKKLDKMLTEALEKETTESLEQWLSEKSANPKKNSNEL